MEKKHKTLQELTILDGFMFGAVMMDLTICQEFLERVLGFPIERLEIVAEKSLIYHPEYKGIRLDIFAKDENNTHYDVEMQVRSTPVERRSRYYHSQMDMELLLSGLTYDKLPESYVIFIMNYDPFGQEKYRYSIHSQCKECPDMEINDGVHTIILSNRGKNFDEVPEELVSFLQYTKMSLADSEYPSEDEFITRIQSKIREIKGSREMGERYMHLLELIQEERDEARKEGLAEGRAEGRAEGLTEGLAKGRAAGLEEGQEIAVINLTRKGLLSIENAAKELGISCKEMEDMIKLKDSNDQEY